MSSYIPFHQPKYHVIYECISLIYKKGEKTVFQLLKTVFGINTYLCARISPIFWRKHNNIPERVSGIKNIIQSTTDLHVLASEDNKGRQTVQYLVTHIQLRPVTQSIDVIAIHYSFLKYRP